MGGTGEQCWWNSVVEQCNSDSGTVLVEQWNSNGGKVGWNSGKMMVEPYGRVE